MHFSLIEASFTRIPHPQRATDHLPVTINVAAIIYVTPEAGTWTEIPKDQRLTEALPGAMFYNGTAIAIHGVHNLMIVAEKYEEVLSRIAAAKATATA